jgi:hypothetical protein
MIHLISGREDGDRFGTEIPEYRRIDAAVAKIHFGTISTVRS